MSLRLSEFAPTVQLERDIFQLLDSGTLDQSVLDIILPGGVPLEYETALWDYKREFPNTSGKHIAGATDPDEHAICEFMKDVVAFHNSFGGYIVGGVGEFQSEPLVGCKNSENFAFRLDKLNDKLTAYTKSNIRCRIEKFTLSQGGTNRCISLLYVPRRGENSSIVRFVKGAPENKKKQAFQKGDIFARIDDKCLSARVNNIVIPFVCSKRLLQNNSATPYFPAENNLPPRDPNLVRFIGRADYLDKLWWWMVEQNVPLKVLTALGGTGKTSIAYEFCSQIVQNKPSWLEKVIWLSAKKQTYSAIQGVEYAATRVDFFDIGSFWEALSREVGIPEEVIDQADDSAELVNEILGIISELPCLVVIDDIDTLSLEQQNELFSQVQVLSGRAFASGSRFLITSRLEFGGLDQKVKVEGFPESEFQEYLKILVEQTGIPINETLSHKLWVASLGSPIFAASVFRLARLGTNLSAAINAWKGRDGEDVRRFAFAREIGQLSDAECRTLYALIVLGETTQIELGQVLEIDQSLLIQHLSRIREYHLFAASDASLRGARLVVPAPVLMMSEIVKEKINDPKRIEKECARARNNTERDDYSVAFLVGQIIALWRDEDLDGALDVAKEAVRRNPKSSDLPCMLGRCQLKVVPSDPKAADKSFKVAFDNGCTRIELAPLWIEAKKQISDWVGVSEIAAMLPNSDIRGRAALTVAMAEANLGVQALSRSDRGQAEVRFKRSMFEVQRAIQERRADESLPALREVARESARRYVSIVNANSERAGDKIDVFVATMDAFRCHISEASILLTGATALHEWARDVFSRERYDPAAADILTRRLSDLDQVIDHIEDEPFDRTNLVDTLSRISIRLKEDLSAYIEQGRRQS